ncbi:MAG: T9SS type A sorting domain-containing protein, partial [Ignavibacteria bacterium]
AQNNVDWDTWSGGGGTSEDPFVSSNFAYSGSNSVVEIPGNDFIRRHGDQTTGKWWMSFLFYIPTGQSGYFNTMNDFDGGFVWGMDAFFDVGGDGRLDTEGGGGGGNVVNFSWAVAQWNQAIVVVDLDAVPPLAEFWIGTGPPLTQVATWDWTLGGTKPTMLAVTDFFGGAGTDEMYIDDYYMGDAPPVILPVELTSFAANVNNNGDVILNWTTASELNNQLFEIERRSEEGQYLMIGYVNGHGTTTESQEYSYIDNTVETGTYFYRLKQIDFLGTYEYSDEIEVEVKGPLTFGLQQNYPNPFNPSTHIKYNVPESGVVKLAIYNMLGEEVAVLVDGMVEAGFYEVTFNASNLPSGAYFYRLQSDKQNQVKKMLLMK